LPNSEVIKLAEEPLAELQPEMRAAESRRHTEEADLRDRSSLDEPPGIWTPVLLIALATLGALLGRFLILGAPDAARFTLANKSALELWAGLIGGLCGYGLAAFVVMINWLLEVRRLFTPRMPWPSVGRWILATLLTLALLSLVTATIPAGSVNGRPVHLFSHQIFGITIAGGVAAIPGLVGFLALRSLARNDSQWEQEPRCQVLLVVRLRQHLRRFLGTFGLFLTLYVVTTANRRQLVLTFYKDATYPQDYAVLLGLLFAAVLALFYVAATMAINWRCDRLMDKYAPIPSPDADDISTSLGKRRDLAALLGADSSWQQTFQNGLIVLAPLLTGLIGTALPK
jgi:hypothetical protein